MTTAQIEFKNQVDKAIDLLALDWSYLKLEEEHRWGAATRRATKILAQQGLPNKVINYTLMTLAKK